MGSLPPTVCKHKIILSLDTAQAHLQASHYYDKWLVIAALEVKYFAGLWREFVEKLVPLKLRYLNPYETAVALAEQNHYVTASKDLYGSRPDMSVIGILKLVPPACFLP